VTSHVAQRDGVAGRGHAGKPHLAPRRPGTHWRAPPRRSGGLTACRSPARWMLPGLAPFRLPRITPRVSRHPAGSRPSRRRPRVPAASDVPAEARRSPCAVTHDQPYREGRRAACGMHGGRGCQRHGNPGRPCRRQLRTFTSSAAMYKSACRTKLCRGWFGMLERRRGARPSLAQVYGQSSAIPPLA
jgi:hypothetical protein